MQKFCWKNFNSNNLYELLNVFKWTLFSKLWMQEN